MESHEGWDNNGHTDSNVLRHFLSNVEKWVSDELCVYHEHNHSLNDELDGRIETMVFSAIQQAIACNPRVWKEIVSLRKDGQYKLIWYPTPMICPGDRDLAHFLSATTLLAQNHFSRCVQAMVQLQGSRRIQTLPGFHQRIEEWKEMQESESKRPYEFYEAVFPLPDEPRNPSTHVEPGDALFFISCSPWGFQQHSSGYCMYLVLLAITDQKRGTLEDTNVAPKLSDLQAAISCRRRLPKDLAGRDVTDPLKPSQMDVTLFGCGPLADAIMGRASWEDEEVQEVVRWAFDDDQTAWNAYVADTESQLRHQFYESMRDLPRRENNAFRATAIMDRETGAIRKTRTRVAPSASGDGEDDAVNTFDRPLRRNKRRKARDC